MFFCAHLQISAAAALRRFPGGKHRWFFDCAGNL